jgi:predicted DNA-binding transcriptional regulator AlpA
MKTNECAECALRTTLEQLLLECGPLPRRIQAVTPRQVGSKMQFSDSTMWARIKVGDKQYREDFPKPYRDGGLTRFFEHEVDAYMLRLGWCRPMTRDAHFSALKSLWTPESSG